jgi:acyl-CoA thioesterase
MATTFSTLLGASTSELVVPADWMQGRSAFAGLQAAFAVQAMRAQVPAEVPLRTLQVTFVAPAAELLRARTSVLRTGASATHVEVRLTGPDDTLATIALGVFGRARTSAVALQPEPPARVTAPPITLPYVPNLVPAFIQHFAVTWRRGAPPFAGAADRHNTIELAMTDDAPRASERHAIALADVIPPVALSFLRTPAPGSTLTWMLELLADRFDHPLTGWLVDAELVAARDGYTSQAVTLWAPDGSPAALSRQSMLVFG